MSFSSSLLIQNVFPQFVGPTTIIGDPALKGMTGLFIIAWLVME
jgi:hypothetical protein